MRQQKGPAPTPVREKRQRRRQLRERNVGKPKSDPKFERDLQRLVYGMEKAIARFGDLDIATFIALAVLCPEFRKTPEQTAWMWKTVMGRYLAQRASQLFDQLFAKRLRHRWTSPSRAPRKK